MPIEKNDKMNRRRFLKLSSIATATASIMSPSKVLFGLEASNKVNEVANRPRSQCGHKAAGDEDPDAEGLSQGMDGTTVEWMKETASRLDADIIWKYHRSGSR